MSSLSAYLAKNYLTASTTPTDLSDRPKKRRKKDKDKDKTSSKSATTSANESLIIADDDEDLSLAANKARTRKGREDDEDDDMPTLMDDNRLGAGGVRSAEFRAKKNSAWKNVASAGGLSAAESQSHPSRAIPDAGTVEGEGEGAEEEEGAEQILAQVRRAEDARLADRAAEDAPAVLEEEEVGPKKMMMESGAKAGLQTAEETRRLVEAEAKEREREEREERRRRKKMGRGGEGDAGEETIYRDATGRRIDVSMKRAEARMAEVEREKAKKKEREEAMGDVQRRMREERKAEVEEARFLTVARGVEDEEMNEHLKGVVRWDDPMAAYLAARKAEDGVGGGRGEGRGEETAEIRRGGVKKKIYSGAAAPNRYGILPGWRWDGVDRGNGFEKDWFQARSRTKRNEELSYQWQMDE
jgi:pre-mRNA-splicing factor CWC26